MFIHYTVNFALIWKSQAWFTSSIFIYLFYLELTEGHKHFDSIFLLILTVQISLGMNFLTYRKFQNSSEKNKTPKWFWVIVNSDLHWDSKDDLSQSFTKESSFIYEEMAKQIIMQHFTKSISDGDSHCLSFTLLAYIKADHKIKNQSIIFFSHMYHFQ